MKILGISAYYHDSAAVLIDQGEIISAAQEERFSRVKHDDSFPLLAIKYCLEEAAIDFEDLDAVVFYDKPFLKFERLLQTYLETAPKGIWQFVKAMPNWLKQKLFIKDQIKNELESIGNIDWEKTDLLFSKHHLSHAASCFFASSLKEATIVTMDGVGEWATASIALGKDNKITTLKELHFPNSLGLFYSAITYFLGFKVNSGEYKVMGLAPYAEDNNELVKEFISKLKDEVIEINEDGSIHLKQHYFKYAHSFRMINEKKFENLLGIEKRNEEGRIEAKHYCLAKALQLITEEVVVKMCKHAVSITGINKICLAGGVALNCVANGKLVEEGFDTIYVQPAAGDAGNALGAAFAAYHMHYGKERILDEAFDKMKWSRLGPAYSDNEIFRAIETFDLSYNKMEEQDLIKFVGSELLKGSTVAWFQGRMEFGPRALGGRSILGNPLLKDTQSKLNLKVKQRESFRPFAPIMLQDDFAKFFGKDKESPYMLFVHKLLKQFRKKATVKSDNLIEKINEERSVLPAITHIDYSARIQTVSSSSDSLLYKLLKEFKRLSGIGVLVNTSFNLRGEPIVCSPKDAIATFLSTEIDFLVLEGFVISREKNLALLKELVKVKLD